MGSIAIHPITISTLQHVSTFGPCTLDALRLAVPGVTSKTTGNLVQLGHCARTAQGLVITTKGREKLRSVLTPGLPADPAPAAERTALPAQPAEQATTSAPPSASPMMSNAEIEAAILKVLQRSRVRVSLPDISRRTHLAEHLVRPTLTTMVQAGAVETTAGKPALYYLSAAHLMRNRLQPERFGIGGPSEQLADNAYRCPELQRNPGIAPERFAAYALPSRVGNRLHWPDGRVTLVTEHPGLPA